MKTYEQILTMAETLGDDACIHDCDDEIFVEFDDFAGFDEDWSEITRKFDDIDAVRAFRKMLAEEALEIDDDFYTTYYFDGLTVKTGYTSYSI